MITNDLTHQRAELARLDKMSLAEIATEADKHCPVCGSLITPTAKEYAVLGRQRRVIFWPERCCEFEF